MRRGYQIVQLAWEWVRPRLTSTQTSRLEFPPSTTVLGRRYHLNDEVSWQKGVHHVRFGGDWETSRGGRTNLNDEPVTMSLFSPEIVRDFNGPQPPASQIPLPAAFLTVQDILQLPLENFTVGIGNPFVPQAGFGKARVAPLLHLFFQDTWHLRPHLVVDYGMAWTYDAPLNYDLTKPQYLASVLGTSGLRPTHRNWKNFSPSLGFAWNLRRDGKTVIRGGVGVYYDFQTSTDISDEERVSLGPARSGPRFLLQRGDSQSAHRCPGRPPRDITGVFRPQRYSRARRHYKLYPPSARS